MTTKPDIFSAFERHLQDKDVSILTLHGYLSDVQQFARWFKQSNSETFNLPAIRPRKRREMYLTVSFFMALVSWVRRLGVFWSGRALSMEIAMD